MHFFVLFLAGIMAGNGNPQIRTVHSEIRRPLTLRFAGDCLFSNYYSFDPLDTAGFALSSCDVLRSADIAMVNLEGPITDRGNARIKPYTFRMSRRALAELKAGGVDIVNIANNHVSDFGSEGIWDTIKDLDSAGILHVGAGVTDASAYQPAIISRPGWRIAFFGYYAGDEALIPSAHSAGVAVRSLRNITKAIEAVKHNVDAVVINLHWGDENSTQPDPNQRIFAHALIDAGADIVIGHHPHVWQGVESYHGAIIAYSLGNFIFGGNSKSSYPTGVLEIQLSDDGASYRYIPVLLDHWKIRVLNGANADMSIAYMRGLSSNFSDLEHSSKERQ